MATEISGSTGVNKIQDGTIVNADINASAAIAGTKLTMPTGSVLQVVTGVLTATTSLNAASYTTMYGATITPSSTSSKILVRAMVGGLYMNVGGSNQSNWRLARGSSGCTGQNTNFHTENGRNATVAGTRSYINMEILDSPNTTSATTYNVQAHRHNGSGSFQINDTAATSTIILMEIQG